MLQAGPADPSDLGLDAGPLVLAEVGYYLPIYRSVSARPVVVDVAVEPRAAHRPRAARRGVAGGRPALRRRPAPGPERLTAALASGEGATADPAEAVASAVAGRVATLVVTGSAPVWGRHDDGRVTVHAEPSAGDVDLVEVAALATLATGGTVHTEPDAGPGDPPVAALPRW